MENVGRPIEGIAYYDGQFKTGMPEQGLLLCNGGYSCRGRTLYPLIGYASKV